METPVCAGSIGNQGTSNGLIGQRFSALEQKKTALFSAKSAKIACCAHRWLQKTALKAQRGSKSQRPKARTLNYPVGNMKYWHISFYPYNWVSEKNGKTNLAKGSMALTVSRLDLKFSWQIVFLITCFCYISSLHVHKVVCPSFL